MRRLALLVALAGCRQALGIPESGNVELFTIGGTITGTVGITGGSAKLLSNGEEIVVAADGPFTFTRERENGSEYDVTGANCVVINGRGAIDGDDITNIEVTCDGVLSLRDFGTTAPLAFDQPFDPSVLADHTLRASFLVQETAFAPAFNYPGAAEVMRVQYASTTLTKAGDGRWGPLALNDEGFLSILVTHPAFGMREYQATIRRTMPPSMFGYGKADPTAANDRMGGAIAATNTLLVAGVPDRNVAIVFRRSGASWKQEAVLTPSGTPKNFGAAVAIEGTRIVVGAPADDTTAGSVYEFRLSGTTWTEMMKLQAPSPVAGDRFGAAVAMAVGIVVIGAPRPAGTGAAYTFDAASLSPIAVGGLATGDRFGASVAVSPSGIYAIGAPGDDGTYPDEGAVYLAGAASQLLKPQAPSAGDAFGTSVAIDVSLVYVGAPFDDGPGEVVRNAGAVYAFAFTGTQTQYIPAPMPAADDQFGASLAVNRDVLAIAAPYRNDPAIDAGAVYAFRLGTATLIKADNAGAHDAFGTAIALTSEMLVVGAPSEDSSATGWNGNKGDGGVDTGAVYTFR